MGRAVPKNKTKKGGVVGVEKGPSAVSQTSTRRNYHAALEKIFYQDLGSSLSRNLVYKHNALCK
jgi:hypothetical protein